VERDLHLCWTESPLVESPLAWGGDSVMSKSLTALIGHRRNLNAPDVASIWYSRKIESASFLPEGVAACMWWICPLWNCECGLNNSPMNKTTFHWESWMCERDLCHFHEYNWSLGPWRFLIKFNCRLWSRTRRGKYLKLDLYRNIWRKWVILDHTTPWLHEGRLWQTSHTVRTSAKEMYKLLNRLTPQFGHFQCSHWDLRK